MTRFMNNPQDPAKRQRMREKRMIKEKRALEAHSLSVQGHSCPEIAVLMGFPGRKSAWRAVTLGRLLWLEVQPEFKALDIARLEMLERLEEEYKVCRKGMIYHSRAERETDENGVLTLLAIRHFRKNQAFRERAAAQCDKINASIRKLRGLDVPEQVEHDVKVDAKKLTGSVKITILPDEPTESVPENKGIVEPTDKDPE